MADRETRRQIQSQSLELGSLEGWTPSTFVSSVGWGLATALVCGPPGKLAPQHCMQPPHPTFYLLHESKLFSPARAQLLLPGKGMWP